MQAHLYEALLGARALQVSTGNGYPRDPNIFTLQNRPKLLKPIKDLKPYDWRQSTEEAPYEEVIEPFKAAQAFLKKEALEPICAF